MMPVTRAAVVEHGVGDRAHHADAAAAIDQADAVLGEDCAEGAGGLHEGRVGAGAGAAIDADFSNFAEVFDSVHALHVQCVCGSVKAAAGNPWIAGAYPADRVIIG